MAEEEKDAKQRILDTAIRLFALVIPLAWLGAQWYGIEGIFGGMAVANLLAGLLGLLALRRAFETRRPKTA